MTDETTPVVEPVETSVKDKPKLGALSLVIAALFGLLYAYDVWEAVGNLIGIPTIYRSLGAEGAVPWWLLIAAVALLVVIYAIAFVLGLHRNTAERALLLLVGLAVSSALFLATIGVNSLIFSDLLHDLGR
jgi:hypothetical protein